MSLNNYKAQRSGFTIVELLIVVVVIAILAAITIVSYNGITQQASASAALANATSVIKKAELYANDASNAGYPATLAALTSATSDKTFALPASATNLVTTTLSSSNPATKSTKDINFLRCGTTGTATVPANYAAITISSGVQVNYWNYQTSALGTLNAGVVSGNYNTFPVACFISLT